MTPTYRAPALVLRALGALILVAGIVLTLAAGTAGAQEYPDGGSDRPPPVEEPQFSAPGGGADAVGPAAAAPDASAPSAVGGTSDALAYTGAALAALVAVGLGLIASGAAMRRASDDKS